MHKIKEKIFNKTKPFNGCLIWTGKVNSDGYGTMKYLTKTYPIHRLVFEIFHRPILKGKVISRICHNKLCIQPSHLFEIEKHDVKTNGGPGSGRPLRTIKDIKQVLYKRSKKENDCLIWQGAVDGGGYPHIGWNKKYKTGHRLSYEIHKGPIPPGMLVCHKCDIRRCINPDHLFLGTHKDNSRDAVSKGRIPKNDVKLTPKKVEKIRELYATGTHTQRTLASQFGVSKACIWDIVNQNHWQTGQEPLKPSKKYKNIITFEQAEEIRAKYKTGQYFQRQLGLEYGISQTSVWEILTNRIWIKK